MLPESYEYLVWSAEAGQFLTQGVTIDSPPHYKEVGRHAYSALTLTAFTSLNPSNPLKHKHEPP